MSSFSGNREPSGDGESIGTRLLTTTTIHIGGNKAPMASTKKLLPRHSAFIPADEDGKQFISKDESELLRDSILRLNRPRISRPWFDQPVASANAKKGATSPTARSNSSSGCSSDPQSGPASPVSSKCSSEGNSTGAGIDGITRLEIGGGAKMTTMPSGMLSSASLVQKAVSPVITATVHSAANANGQKCQQPSLPPLSSSFSPAAQFTALKRKEFPSYQRQRVPMPPQKCVQHCHPAMALPQKVPSPPSVVLRRADPAEEVEELSKAARKQMAILEELEVEDKERKTRISSNMAKGVADNSPTTSSPGSSRESTATRLSTGSSSASPLAVQNGGTSRNGGSGHRSSCSPSPSSSATSSSTSNGRTKGIGPAETNGSGVSQAKRREQAVHAQNDQIRPEMIQQQRQHSASANRQSNAVTQQKQEQHQMQNARQTNLPELECRACGHMITDVILQALGASFHPDCFRCSKCAKCLDGVPFAVEQGGAVICMDDYERHFVPHCHACKKSISAVNEFGQVVRVIIHDREYHIQCYCCEGCGMQLSNEPENRCFPLGEHLLCRQCHTIWRRMGHIDMDAAISDL